jgi:hypothetical protein
MRVWKQGTIPSRQPTCNDKPGLLLSIDQQGKGPEQSREILALVEAAEKDKVTLWQSILLADRSQSGLIFYGLQCLPCRLVGDVDPFWWNVQVTHDVPLGCLGNGDDGLGLSGRGGY